ncbi:MAG: zinc ribbon domain-containing protein [Bacteroidales bacterium]|nr:zinc ribbon domain-containing protein [Bacteroidales bacterium]
MNEKVRTRERVKPAVATAAASTQGPSVNEGSGVCPHCGAIIEEGLEFCPVCGAKLVDYCTFCGAPMRPDDIDCPECGMPAEGIICPKCGIRNHRPFCGQCGQPLSRAARIAVDRAKLDPKVKEAAVALMRIAELEAELDGAGPGPEDEAPREPTEGELRMRELMGKVGFKPAVAPEAEKPKTRRTRAEIMAEYQKAVEDANRAMEEMLPPAGMTPQEQRNYCTARKVAVMETVQETWRGIPFQESMAWECNYCHVLHNNPHECAKPHLGGKWVPCVQCEVVQSGGQIFTTNVERKVYKRL